ncbi:MAG: hypothetical protein ACPGQR_00590 [Marinirhabdus sp.]
MLYTKNFRYCIFGHVNEIWTTEAKNTFAKNIEYLKARWGHREVDVFVEKSFEMIDHLKIGPKPGQWAPVWKARKFLVAPQIYLFYEIDDHNLVLFTFWNNHQKPL